MTKGHRLGSYFVGGHLNDAGILSAEADDGEGAGSDYYVTGGGHLSSPI
jgi:hypothetical protein